MNGRDQWAFDSDRIVVTGCASPGLVHVVDDVDATHECNAAINGYQLAMQASQSVAPQAETCQFGSINHDLGASCCQFRLQMCRKRRGTEAVNQYAGDDAARHGALDGLYHRSATGIIFEDVGFQLNISCRAVNRGDQRREEFATAVQQGQPVAFDKVSRHGAIGGQTVLRGRRFSTMARRNVLRPFQPRSRARRCDRV